MPSDVRINFDQAHRYIRRKWRFGSRVRFKHAPARIRFFSLVCISGSRIFAKLMIYISPRIYRMICVLYYGEADKSVSAQQLEPKSDKSNNLLRI